MASGLVSNLGLALIAGIGVVTVGEMMAARLDLRHEFLPPEDSALARLDDEALRQKFLVNARAHNYRSRHFAVSSTERETVGPLASAQRELERRGEQEWARLQAFRRVAEPTSMNDARLLEMLYAMPEKWDDEDARLYEPVMREILRRGGEWDSISADWTWVGLDNLSNSALKDLWNAAIQADTVNGVRQRERVLSEIIHRGGDMWRRFLEDQLVARAQAVAHDTFSKPGADLEVLTALRRVEANRDPVAIRVDEPLQEVVAFPNLPKWDVALVNQDVKGTTVGYEVGGDYRSGRLARWRVVAIDEHGNELPESKAGGFMGGGISQFGILGPKDQWTTTLNAASYLPALPPGKYTIRILYHDGVTIADEASVKGLIYSSSPEIRLTVRPMIVRLEAGEADAIRKQVYAIHDEPLKMVHGSYGPWAYDFVPPDSDRGKVLARGQNAIPVLVSMLDDVALGARQRAEILAILFTLTGENSPMADWDGSAVLGSYIYQEGPWVVAGQGNVMGIGAGGSGKVPGTADVERQLDFAKRWRSWKEAIKIQ